MKIIDGHNLCFSPENNRAHWWIEMRVESLVNLGDISPIYAVPSHDKLCQGMFIYTNFGHCELGYDTYGRLKALVVE